MDGLNLTRPFDGHAYHPGHPSGDQASDLAKRELTAWRALEHAYRYLADLPLNDVGAVDRARADVERWKWRWWLIVQELDAARKPKEVP